MLKRMIEDAAAGRPVYITRIHDAFAALPPGQYDPLVLVVDRLDVEERRSWELRLPALDRCDPQERSFVGEYLYAEVYNLLSSLGARTLTVYADRASTAVWDLATSLSRVFWVDVPRKDRRGYGRAINVLDRMVSAVAPAQGPFRFVVEDLSRLPALPSAPRPRQGRPTFALDCTRGLEGRAFCGIDVGGTDIKAVLVDDGRVVDYKEYDWFPTSFLRSRQLVDPIVLIARLLLARLSLHRAAQAGAEVGETLALVEAAMDRGAKDEAMRRAIEALDAAALGGDCRFDGIGLCFPDVVVRNKIVGGEVYKTRGIRTNPDIDYEADFAELTDLDLHLAGFLLPGGRVRIVNDGPMAAFTAAVELAAGEDGASAARGVFAHTLGTELGTGWVTEDGSIPDIPLEVYNFIVDLGSWPERAFESDDLRSVNNFNTGLPGTLQKYCSQSGVFRLALKYFPSERPDLLKELEEAGYAARRDWGGKLGWYVPVEPVDQRKPFLEHLMRLPDRERDETTRKIWREIGESLAVTFLETRRILEPAGEERFLFGRLVKNQTCFDLMVEGARRIAQDARFVVAGTGLANTPLMKQLEAHPEFTVAQFAQAVGAVYFANQR